MLSNSTELDRVTALKGSHEIPIFYKKIVNISARASTIIVNFGGYNLNHKYYPSMIYTDGKNIIPSNLAVADHSNSIANVALFAPGLHRIAKRDGTNWSLPQTFSRDMYVVITCVNPGNISVSFDQAVSLVV